jgi:uncharacterized protein (DUF1684 family)
MGDEYEARIRAHRARREERLRDPEGWLALVGLSWLAPGENRVGADPDADVILRGPDAPEAAGRIVVAYGRARFVAAPDCDVTHGGAPVTQIDLGDDLGGDPTVLAIGSLRFHLIRRGDRLGVRVRDLRAPALAAFGGLDYFPVDPAWRLVLPFEAAARGTTIATPDVIGLETDEPVAGWLQLTGDGVEQRLAVLPGGEDGALWLIFGDATNGETTYAGGRFLYTEPPRGDSVVVDFNLAYNPPCVFTPYATCPLPPPGNRLPFAVRAGERGFRSS